MVFDYIMVCDGYGIYEDYIVFDLCVMCYVVVMYKEFIVVDFSNIVIVFGVVVYGDSFVNVIVFVDDQFVGFVFEFQILRDFFDD